MDKRKRENLLVDLTRQMEQEVKEEKTPMYRRGFLRTLIAASAGGAVLASASPSDAWVTCGEAADLCSRCDALTNTCATTNACPTGNQCTFDVCGINTCAAGNSCDRNTCNTTNTCGGGVHSCNVDACNVDLCNTDDSCNLNACVTSDTDCGYDDISCFWPANTCQQD